MSREKARNEGAGPKLNSALKRGNEPLCWIQHSRRLHAWLVVHEPILLKPSLDLQKTKQSSQELFQLSQWDVDMYHARRCIKTNQEPRRPDQGRCWWREKGLLCNIDRYQTVLCNLDIQINLRLFAIGIASGWPMITWYHSWLIPLPVDQFECFVGFYATQDKRR